MLQQKYLKRAEVHGPPSQNWGGGDYPLYKDRSALEPLSLSSIPTAVHSDSADKGNPPASQT